MGKYHWRVELTNGNIYIVETKEGNIGDFMKKYCQPNMFNDIKLKDEIDVGCIKMNTIMLRGDSISTVAYSCNWE